MKPYSSKRQTKGISGCRKSKDSCHRRRCLRTDKKSARALAKRDLEETQRIDTYISDMELFISGISDLTNDLEREIGGE